MVTRASSRIEWTDATWKWCTAHKEEHEISAFGRDRSRSDGLAASCRASRHTGRPRGWHARPPINPKTGRPGPARDPRRDGDKKQARSRINHDVQLGLRPSPNSLPCADCGHIYRLGGRRHEYDHHKGYGAEHHGDVEALCSSCHHKREARRG
jgi:hypothetical protein